MNGMTACPAMSTALTRLQRATAGLDLTDEQQHHLAWLRGWGPGVVDSIAGVIEQARAAADELEGASHGL